MSEWKEGKPEEAYETVWAWDGERVLSAYVDVFGTWHAPWDGAIKSNITHWTEIEIPKPPEIGEEKEDEN